MVYLMKRQVSDVFLGNSAKKNQQNGIVGLDLCPEYVQASICPSGSEQAETRFMLLRNQLEEMVPDENILLRMARICLTQKEIYLAVSRSVSVVVCLESVTRELVEQLNSLAAELSIPQDKMIYLDRAECFFGYSVRQPEELWNHACMICDFTGENMKTRILEISRNENPVKIRAYVNDYPEMVDYHEAEERLSEGQKRKMDQAFLNILSEVTADRVIDTVYLLGEVFEDDWYDASLQILCKNRRVFLGDNLYSKGACYCGRMRLEQDRAGRYQFVSSQKLEVNVGLNALVGGKAICQPLLEIGTNWYEAENECEFYLNRDLSFSLKVTADELTARSGPVPGLPSRTKSEQEVVVTLDGLPARPDKATRIHLKIFCPRPGAVRLIMEDLGFGEFYPATHKTWEEEFSLGGVKM